MNNYCMNCGKSGHNSKLCSEPIISCGIICFKINNTGLHKIEKFLFNKYITIEDYNYNNLDYINKVDFHKSNIKFLLIQRKHSLSYIEFLRGRYDENDNIKVKEMFELMTKFEVTQIKTLEFDTLWDKLWEETARSKTFLKELNVSKVKFNYLKTNNLLDELVSKYDTPEWGFPKGRRNKYETNVECANREFVEESNLTNYMHYDRINLIEENFTGTDLVNYKHIYYLAGSEVNELNYSKDNYEIGNIGWFTLDQVLKLIRPYNTSKIDIINQIYFFLSVITDKINIKQKGNSLYSV